VDSGQKSRNQGTGNREQKCREASGRLLRFRAEPFDFAQGRLWQRGSDSGLCGLGVKGDHGTILRQGGVMIGKLRRDQRSGVRDQKKNELGARWTAFGAARGLDKKRMGVGDRVSGAGTIRHEQVSACAPRSPRARDRGTRRGLP
jgi:hypothetical protein